MRDVPGITQLGEKMVREFCWRAVQVWGQLDRRVRRIKVQWTVRDWMWLVICCGLTFCMFENRRRERFSGQESRQQRVKVPAYVSYDKKQAKIRANRSGATTNALDY